MILVITNSKDATATYLLSELQKSGLPYLRLDTDQVVAKASVDFTPGRPRLRYTGHAYAPADFSVVWYRRPERLKDVRFESSPENRYALDEWAEVLEGFFAHIPVERWVNHPARNAMASHKLEQLSRANAMGLNVPNTLLTQNAAELRAFFTDCEERIVVKPLGTGYIERSSSENDSLIFTNRVQRTHLDDLTDLAVCPTLFQRFIDKTQDVRITLLDNDCHSVALLAAEPDGTQRCDVRRNNMADVIYQPVELPSSVRDSLFAITRSYGLRFAAIDMVVSQSGDWYFLEINPNGQWAWLDLSGGMRIATSFIKAFSND